jgi:hypothetical protein
MNEQSDAEWQKEAETLMNKIVNLVEGKESDMIVEVFACIMADMLEGFSVEDAVPLLLKFMSEVMEKQYGFEVGFTKVGKMQ